MLCHPCQECQSQLFASFFLTRLRCLVRSVKNILYIVNMIPTPTKTEVQNLWNHFHSELPKTSIKTRILFVPHASLIFSGHAALESLSCCIDNPNKIRLFGVRHRPGTNTDHSININVAILRHRYPNAPIESWFSVNVDIVGFLQENLRNVVVFTSDMSHEYNVNSQLILDKEADFISSIIKRNYVLNNTISMCGPDNLRAFCETLTAMGEYPVVRCYDDSQTRRRSWSTNENNKIVSYLSLISVHNKTVADVENEKWKLVFCKAFVLSAIKDPLVRMPSVFQPKSHNGLFITIRDATTTRACIGRFYRPRKNLFANVVEIIPDLVEDARTRWNNPFRKTEWLHCQFTVMENDPVLVQKPTSKNNLYTIDCNGKKGTFIPDVWREHPEWTSKQYLNELLEKAGASGCKNYNLYSVKSTLI